MILIFGKNGQLASSLRKTVPREKKETIQFLSSEEANFLEPNKILSQLAVYKPKRVIISGAYTAVDKAESEKDLALQINTTTPIEIAYWCKQNQAHLTYISTDYVFPGTGQRPWTELDPTQPINYYGYTKALAEKEIQNIGCPYHIIRTSWVYSEFGQNFIKTMLRLGKQKETLSIVEDQIGSPTYAPDLAKCLWEIAFHYSSLESGVFHIAGSGFTSWAVFAETAFKYYSALRDDLLVKSISKIRTSEYPTIAQRPLNSRLSQEKLKTLTGMTLPHWESALNEMISKYSLML